jgi:hypothetical protein
MKPPLYWECSNHPQYNALHICTSSALAGHTAQRIRKATSTRKALCFDCVHGLKQAKQRAHATEGELQLSLVAFLRGLKNERKETAPSRLGLRKFLNAHGCRARASASHEGNSV